MFNKTILWVLAFLISPIMLGNRASSAPMVAKRTKKESSMKFKRYITKEEKKIAQERLMITLKSLRALGF